MAQLLPQHDGMLPYFLLMTSSLAIAHTVVCYISSPVVSTAQFQGPSAPAPSGLLARVYGVKNFYTAMIRGYAAYRISNSDVYALAMLTYVGVFFLYSTELLLYRTSRPHEVLTSLMMSSVGLAWMYTERDFYVH
ncbi:ergosterol biosynthesis protein-like protein Erg28 [Lasiosphaeria ovina]|uniref:Ergosterol biosynthesis protein-like protein Erg28 n=1 Tax=Lasiosphaeria ovina TaxID=92902 RepID=A0AAE0NAI1_9PEZI|nr:ergosterol biosynthesis protein-like protein Erg28 [Lasiosphaeria ovina]